MELYFHPFRHDEEPEEEHLQGSLTSWSEEVSFRQMPNTLSLDGTSKESRGDMKVMLATNVPCVNSMDSSGEQGNLAACNTSQCSRACSRRVFAVEPEKAARLAVRMMSSSLTDFLRRLPIICVEDVGLHPEFSCVVWLMVAVSRGYRPPLCLLEFCLVFVIDLSSAPQRYIWFLCSAKCCTSG